MYKHIPFHILFHYSSSQETEYNSLWGDQSWVFTGRTDLEAETPIHWPLDAKN